MKIEPTIDGMECISCHREWGKLVAPSVCPDCTIETRIPLSKGRTLCCESTEQNEGGTSYVRILDKDEIEIAYWNSEEWTEEPQEVMGALMGAIKGI